ncbi:MAG: hypothetical protein WA705_27550 [Candidatus Ozemobacteraceae bacterium]
MSEVTFYKPLPPIICLTGIDGCGKSTHLKTISRRLAEEKKVTAAFLTVWDISRNKRYQSHSFISDKEAIYRYLATLHGGARMLFIAHALMESLELLLEEKPDVILADGYWYKYLFSESLHGLGVDWLLKAVTGFPEPHKCVLLDIPAERSWARKPGITPYECGMAEPGEKTFLSFQTRLRQEMLRYARGKNWSVISVDRPVNDVADELWKLLKDEV